MEYLYADFTKQYNNTYKIRLQTLKPLIPDSNDIVICDTIQELGVQKDLCQIKGILFISSDLKTTIFDHLNSDKKTGCVKNSTYISSDVKYFAEDETGKIEIIFSVVLQNFVCTGMCLGFVGKMVGNIFDVCDVLYPIYELNSQKTTEIEPNNDKIMFISGTELSKTNDNFIYLRVMLDYLSINNICEVVIFGKFFEKDFEEFKNCIECSVAKITLIPEHSDFSCCTFPLLPVHKKLFNKDILSYPSPCLVDMHVKTFAFVSYEIIKDLLKYISQEVDQIQDKADGYIMHLKLESLKDVKVNELKLDANNITTIVTGLLKSRLLCPSGPDTVSVIPYYESEVFYIDRKVDFFVIPNCDSEIFVYIESLDCTVMTVPNFNNTKKGIKLDIQKNDYEFIEYKKDSSSGL